MKYIPPLESPGTTASVYIPILDWSHGHAEHMEPPGWSMAWLRAWYCSVITSIDFKTRQPHNCYRAIERLFSSGCDGKRFRSLDTDRIASEPDRRPWVLCGIFFPISWRTLHHRSAGLC